jgi:hypothetical protein
MNFKGYMAGAPTRLSTLAGSQFGDFIFVVSSWETLKAINPSCKNGNRTYGTNTKMVPATIIPVAYEPDA